MDKNQPQQQLSSLKNTLFEQGYLDEQFLQLEELQDDANPNFVEDVVTSFYSDSARLLHNIEQALGNCPVDFGKLSDLMVQFKGSCSSVGARTAKGQGTRFQEYCNKGNVEGCARTLEQVKQELAALRARLETYFQMIRQS